MQRYTSLVSLTMFAFPRLRFVLVGTQHPGNIGAAARAMKTMGISRLVLVAPECQLDEHAYRRSAGAEDVLEAASVHTVLADAVADCTFVLGCTARTRRVAFEELRPAAAASQILANINAAGEVALLFGRERTGLTNEELQLCHVAVHIPADPLFSSLNLAAAVQILAYEIRLASLDAPSAPLHSTSGFRKTPASHAQLEGLFGQFKQTLDEIDFHKGRAPESAMRKLRRLFAKAELTQQEIRLLRGVLSDVQRIVMLKRQRDT
ncbi:RNA methyltransferase [Xylella fastidiosa]|nr:RNA methyltransferase [Xylella fastidiosa]ALR03729.2 RNA methyltransferase [Xylella fastidiosa]ALR07645.2 RNA methyltransferase [Xylella fastidiosa]MDG5823734.1 RNA methyltransferase [Xylella fastidiosa subsp. pauca]MDG5824995.1 RNA methyltransferase [Xylella fastidiosa subsp. pauca]WGZ33171.1 RNA methyltransferase [Xylella fastidiosa subsp. pauca]